MCSLEGPPTTHYKKVPDFLILLPNDIFLCCFYAKIGHPLRKKGTYCISVAMFSGMCLRELYSELLNTWLSLNQPCPVCIHWASDLRHHNGCRVWQRRCCPRWAAVGSHNHTYTMTALRWCSCRRCQWSPGPEIILQGFILLTTRRRSFHPESVYHHNRRQRISWLHKLTSPNHISPLANNS